MFFCLIQDGITLKKTVEEDEEDGMISNKKPRKASQARDKLYGCFVKVIDKMALYTLPFSLALTIKITIQRG